MPFDMSVIEGKYFHDLLDQPVALEKTFEQLQSTAPAKKLISQLNKGKFDSIVLTGMGSSFHGLHPLLIQLTQAGFPAVHVETSELIYYRETLLNRKSLIVAVSQSGQSAEIIRLLQQNRRRAPIIAVTNTPDSPLAKHSDAVILTDAGAEFSVSCKTYVAALMALRFLGNELCGTPQARTRRELRAVVPQVRAYLSRWKEHVESIVPKISRVRHLFLAGRGPSLAAVGAGALILKESTQFPAEGLSSAAFRHGPFEMLGPESLLLIFSGDSKTRDLNQRLFNEARQREGYVELVSMKKSNGAFCVPQTSPATLPILEILPVQMLTLALSVVAGKTPGQFRFATKITTVE
jgi:glutamine---fructose-6-phosphate transaminase (isomerizing)